MDTWEPINDSPMDDSNKGYADLRGAGKQQEAREQQHLGIVIGWYRGWRCDSRECWCNLAARQASQPTTQEAVQARDRQWCAKLAEHDIAARATYGGEIEIAPSHASGERGQPSISDMGVSDVAYGIALRAIEKGWSAKVLGPYIAGIAIEHGRVEFQRGQQAMAEKAAQHRYQRFHLRVGCSCGWGSTLCDTKAEDSEGNKLFADHIRSLAGAEKQPEELGQPDEYPVCSKHRIYFTKDSRECWICNVDQHNQAAVEPPQDKLREALQAIVDDARVLGAQPLAVLPEHLVHSHLINSAERLLAREPGASEPRPSSVPNKENE